MHHIVDCLFRDAFGTLLDQFFEGLTRNQHIVKLTVQRFSSPPQALQGNALDIDTRNATIQWRSAMTRARVSCTQSSKLFRLVAP
jgi:hypothetical protein